MRKCIVIRTDFKLLANMHFLFEDSSSKDCETNTVVIIPSLTHMN